MPQPISVLFVNTRSALGADVAVHLTVANHLDPARCRVAFATNSRAPDVQQTLARLQCVDARSVHCLDLGLEVSGRSRIGKAGMLAANAGTLGVAVCRLARLVRRHRADVIHTTDRPRDALVGSVLARLTPARHVVHFHLKWYPTIGRATSRALQRCDGVIAISQFVRRSLVDGGIDPAKVHVAYNAVDGCEFDPARVPRGALRQRMGLDADVPLIAVIARIMLWKGHGELLEAMPHLLRRVPAARVAIIGKEDVLAGDGRGGYTDRLRSRAAELGLEDAIHWLGWSDDVPALLADVDALCLPSLEEPFGLVVTEAMAMAKPVVAFETGAMPEIVEDGVHGRLVPGLDTAALGNALGEVLSDRDAAAAMGRRGRERVTREFTPQRQAEAVLGIYGRVCGR